MLIHAPPDEKTQIMAPPTETKATLKAAEQALQEAIKRESLMEKQHYQSISEIVHDIKNPMTAMLGYLSLIRNEVAGPLDNKTYSAYFNTLDKSANRLLGICNSLLGQYAHAEGETESAQIADVSALVGEIGDLFAAQAKEREIELSTSVADSFPELEADPQELYRAMMNLVSNAIKFTPKGGKVDIQADLDPKDNTFIMVVRDSGVGMTQDQIEQVMTTSLTTQSPHGDVGTGQGLGIVNRIVSDYGGKLDIISTENRGTRIKLKFPKKISLS